MAAHGQSPRLQESCDPSSVLVCSDSWHVASLIFCLRQVTVHEWVQFLEDKLFEFDEHIVVIVLKKRIPKSSILSLAKLN